MTQGPTINLCHARNAITSATASLGKCTLSHGLVSNRALDAADAINLLGLEAKSAFPTLTNLFWSSRVPLPAAIGLAGMGHEGVVVLLQGLTNQDWKLRHVAAYSLREARSDLDKIVPALIATVKSGGSKPEDYLLRGAAVGALMDLHAEPDLVVPVFSEFLTSPDAQRRAWGASLLGRFGADARTAVPLLLKTLADPDPEVRKTVGEALKKIDPGTAARAGLK